MSRLRQLLSRAYRQALRLFHMLVGLIFLGLAAAGASVAVKEWEQYRESSAPSLVRLYLFAGFSVLLVLCGLYSLVKARSVR